MTLLMAISLILIGFAAGAGLTRFRNRQQPSESSSVAPNDESTQQVLDGIDAGVVVVDKAGIIQHINRFAIELLSGRPDTTYDSLEALPFGPDLMAMMAGPTNAHELNLGDDRATQVRIARRNDMGQTVFVLHEITELKRLELMRSDFVANVSHELRTPVSVIRANAETLLDGALEDLDDARNFVSAIHRNSERISNLVADLLDLARIESGSTAVASQPVDLMEVVARTIGSVRTLAEGLNITIHDTMDDSVFCMADEDALEQVLTNLIENAVKYGREEGNIWVRSYATPGRIRVEVIDDGLGIESVHRTRLFERFYRVDKGRSRSSGGTGLGLSIVKHLVNNMGGQVGMEPNRPTGSVFWITLPEA